MNAIIKSAVLGYLLFFTSVGVRAEQVDVQILLAIDVSSSVNYEEFDLQMRGYIAAFRTPEVLEAIQSGAHGKIAVAMTQWAGLQQQRLVLDWTIVSNADEAERVAGQIEYVPRAFPFGGTAITNALRHSYKQFDKSPYISQRKVIDISGDGRPSIGKEPAKLRDEIIGSGVTINGLPILNEEPDLDRYYVKNVLGGVGAFAEVAADYSDFSRAISRKLAQEIKGVFYGM